MAPLGQGGIQRQPQKKRARDLVYKIDVLNGERGLQLGWSLAHRQG